MDTAVQSIEAKAIEIIAGAAKMDPQQISRATRLDEIGISSLELTEVVMDLEDHFGIQVDLNAAEAWDSLKNVGDVIDTIAKLVADQG